jgi:hypothetical protein
MEWEEECWDKKIDIGRADLLRVVFPDEKKVRRDHFVSP